MKKKYLILGYARSGSYLLKRCLNKFFKIKNKKKIKINENIFYEDFAYCDNFILKKKKFYFYAPWEKKKFIKCNLRFLNKIKVLNTHYYNDCIFDYFKDREIILIFRNPIDTVSSLIHYTTKPTILLYNSYKITNKLDLMKNKSFVNKHIDGYTSFYKKILNDLEFKYLSFNYKYFKKQFSNIFKINNKNFFKFKYNHLHSSRKSKKIKQYLIKNYNFDEALKIYQKLNLRKNF